MPSVPHHERHFGGNQTLRDVVIGMSDGLTVPFALAAGISGAVASGHLVVAAGLAEIAAGSIAMGLGGFLAARSDAEHYSSERRREQDEVREKPQLERAEVAGILQGYGLSAKQSQEVVDALSHKPDVWVDFMMRFELGLEKPEPAQAWKSALTIALAYVVGGMVPLAPYFFSPDARAALPASVGFTLVALAIFGFVKGRFTGGRPMRSAAQTMAIGALAAAAAFTLAKLVSG